MLDLVVIISKRLSSEITYQKIVYANEYAPKIALSTKSKPKIKNDNKNSAIIFNKTMKQSFDLTFLKVLIKDHLTDATLRGELGDRGEPDRGDAQLPDGVQEVRDDEPRG